MNPYILMVIDNQVNPSKYSVDELNDNYVAACAATLDAASHAAACAARDAVYYVAVCAACSARDAASYVAACAARDAYMVDFWLDEYFNRTGENKQDYIDAINKLKTK